MPQRPADGASGATRAGAADAHIDGIAATGATATIGKVAIGAAAPPARTNARRDAGNAALWMVGSIVSFIAMAVSARGVSLRHDTFEIMTWRSLVGLLLVMTFAIATRRTAEIPTRRFGAHLLRNVSHFSGQNLWFYALTMIPLAQVFALEFTSPVWVILLSPLILGERITRPRALAAALGFIGVLIVARPGAAPIGTGLIAAAGCAIGFAIAALVTRDMAKKGESIVSIMFWLTAMQFTFGLVLALIDGKTALPDATTAPLLVLIGFAGVAAQACLTRALSLAPASFVVPIDFIRLPLIALVGFALYGEPPDPGVLLGAAVIFMGIWINIRAETRG